jgi:hypothetical protein|tara:strand:+ start:511 stop:1122 length:612 start_codon:yes stop_codon:yes gene_type:complete
MALVKYNNRSILNVTALDSIASGDMNLITTNTISSGVSSSSFTSSIDSTYDTYIFKYINMHPATDATELQFQVSTNGGSSYGVDITSTAFQGYHYESGGSQGVAYYTADDLAQSTNFQNLCNNVGNGNDESMSGTLYLFNPSSTTFVKHWMNNSHSYSGGDFALNGFQAGYFNTTSAVNAVQFKMTGGNIDSGVIKMYGLSKS